MAFELPPLPEFEPTWATFQVWWQQVKEAIEQNEAAQALLFDAIEEVLSGDSGVTGQLAIIGSYSIPTMTITASDVGANVTISVASHVRQYPNGASTPIAAGSITGRAYSTTYAVYYDDDTREDTSPTFHATTDLEEAQHNYASGRHYVGTVVTPAALGAPTTGGSPPAGSGYTAGASAVVIT